MRKPRKPLLSSETCIKIIKSLKDFNGDFWQKAEMASAYL